MVPTPTASPMRSLKLAQASSRGSRRRGRGRDPPRSRTSPPTSSSPRPDRGSRCGERSAPDCCRARPRPTRPGRTLTAVGARPPGQAAELVVDGAGPRGLVGADVVDRGHDEPLLAKAAEPLRVLERQPHVEPLRGRLHHVRRTHRPCLHGREQLLESRSRASTVDRLGSRRCRFRSRSRSALSRCPRCRARMRALRIGLCSRSIHFGGTQAGRSSIITAGPAAGGEVVVVPAHSSVRLCRSVRRLCPVGDVVAFAPLGRPSQPGKQQPPSRAISARV